MQDLVAGHSGVVGPALKKVRSDQAAGEAENNDVEAMLKELRGVALAGHIPECTSAARPGGQWLVQSTVRQTLEIKHRVSD